MLSPRLTNCPECSDISSLLKKIDCKLAELGNNLYNNISYMLNKPVPADDITQLITYRRILLYKLCNPSYVQEYTIPMISSRVIRLTVGCVSRCNTPEPCIEERCDITVIPNTTSTTSTSTSSTSTTTSTSTTIVPTTTTTSSSSTTTSTSTNSSSTTTTTTTIVIPPGAIQFPILIGYETILPVEDIVVSNTLEDMCLFVNNLNNENVNPDSLIVDGTTYYFDPETYILYNSVTNTFAEDGYYLSDAILYVTNGLAEILTTEDFVELCNFTTTTTTTIAVLDFLVNKECSYDPDQLLISVSAYTNGIEPYYSSVTVFNSEIDALANTNWSMNLGYGYSIPPINGTYWMVIKDSVDNIKAKSISVDCFTTTTTTTTTI